ncbi:MAG: hypothetical protein IT355_14895 [Gemmatimonadaceae bacterium]|nr:hypothetical protein [Gemmatimonadaceae bacterium]
MPVNRLLVAAALALGAPGLVLLFGADELLTRGGPTPSGLATWLVGLLGGTLVALALMNWFQRHTMIGGIYGRPLLLANTLVFTNAFFSSLRAWRTGRAPVYAAVAVVAGLLMVAFARKFFSTPAAARSGDAGTA